jgi:hypothetical protein
VESTEHQKTATIFLSHSIKSCIKVLYTAFEVEFFISSLCVQLIAQTNSRVCCIENISLNAEKASAINHTLKRHIATLAAEQEKSMINARCKNGKAPHEMR